MKILVAFGYGAWVILTLAGCVFILGYAGMMTMDQQKPGVWAVAIVFALGFAAISGYTLWELSR